MRSRAVQVPSTAGKQPEATQRPTGAAVGAAVVSVLPRRLVSPCTLASPQLSTSSARRQNAAETPHSRANAQKTAGYRRK